MDNPGLCPLLRVRWLTTLITSAPSVPASRVTYHIHRFRGLGQGDVWGTMTANHTNQCEGDMQGKHFPSLVSGTDTTRDRQCHWVDSFEEDGPFPFFMAVALNMLMAEKFSILERVGRTDE